MTKNKIKYFFRSIGINIFDMREFYTVCPFTEEQIQSGNRKKDLVEWRILAGVWAYMHWENQDKAGEFVNRDRSVIPHYTDHFTSCVEGYFPDLKEKLDLLIQSISNGYSMNGILVMKTNEDQHQNELISLTLLDSKLNELRS